MGDQVLGLGFLVLLIFRNEIVNVALCFTKLHRVHTFTCVTMQESLAPEHGSELLADALETFLNGRRIADEGGAHLQIAGRNMTNCRFDIVGDPLSKLG